MRKIQKHVGNNALNPYQLLGEIIVILCFCFSSPEMSNVIIYLCTQMSGRRVSAFLILQWHLESLRREVVRYSKLRCHILFHHSHTHDDEVSPMFPVSFCFSFLNFRLKPNASLRFLFAVFFLDCLRYELT